MNRNSILTLPLVISAIIGIIVGILIFNGTIAIELIENSIVFATIFAGISLILLFIGAIFAERKEIKNSIEEYGNTIIVGAVGTLVTGFLGLTFFTLLDVGSLVTALLIAFGTFFFILNFISLVIFVVELVNYDSNKKENYCNYVK